MTDFFRFDGQYGPVPLPDGTTRFRLWAPSCKQVTLELEGTEPVPMREDSAGWFETKVPCAPGARYRYRISDDLAVADPASRFQPEGVHGPSEVIDQTAYAWKTGDWKGRPWHEAIIYELHVGTMGGYAGVQTHLDRLAALGVTAIELMPVASFGGTRNWGYDGVLPYAPHPAYGTPDGLKALIDAAHERGIMVLLDVVYNHFGPDGNYLASYADDFFDDNANSPWGRGIAFANPAVAGYFHENVLMWVMEFRFDGVRIDAAWAISDRNWFTGLRQRLNAICEPDRHVHLILENENNDAALLRSGYDAQWNDDFHNVMHVLLTGEHEGYYGQYVENPTAGLATILRDGFLYQGQTSPGATKPRGQKSGDLPTTCFVNFLQNHDQIGNRAFGERLVDLADPEALQAAYAALLLSPFIPMLFMGEEWGSHTPFLFFTDYQGELGEQVLEGRRKEFSKFEAFENAESRARIANPNASSTFDRSIPDQNERDTPHGRSWLALTRTLLQIRNERIVPLLPQARSTGAHVVGDKAVFATWALGKTTLSLALNLGDDTVGIPPIVRDDVVFTTSESSAWQEKGQTHLPPRSATIALAARS
jgi:maltooligosyltrehalose trehalohydrolase